MKTRLLLWAGLGIPALLVLGGGAWLLSLPAAALRFEAPAIAHGEIDATLAALRPPKRKRPLVAIIGINDATETTDYLTPYGILRRADVADVVALSTKAGPVKLFPALTVEPDATVAEFDASHPEGADYVIVPAMSRDDDPDALRWIRNQATNGAIVIGICAGAKVVAEAGLLDGKRATTHWYYRDAMLIRHPGIRYVADRRLVVDKGVVTTTGISASMPMMLTLIEAIADRDKAQAVARNLGLAAWDTRHASGAFRFDRSFALTVVGNVLAFWKREELGIELAPGVDEVALAFVADAWSRTYRSRASTFAAAAGPIESINGLTIVPDRVGAPPADRALAPPNREAPAAALDRSLREIANRYGPGTADVVAMQLEYPARFK